MTHGLDDRNGEAGDADGAPPVPVEVYRDAVAVIDSALRGDRDEVADAVGAVVEKGGERRAYDVAVCLAATMLGEGPAGEYAALDYPGIDKAAYDSRWVAQFVSAYASGDQPTGAALFHAAVADGQLAECLVTLAGSTVATLRHRGPV